MEARSGGAGVFLYSPPMEEQHSELSIHAIFELSAENKNPFHSEARSLYHQFCREEPDWGFRELVYTSSYKQNAP